MSIPVQAAIVTRVYSGQAHKCCCGCKGKYSETKQQITRVVNLINKHADNGTLEELGSCTAIDLGNRTYIAYFD